jgi:membrane carboxypeptidase/penicillin-binding protein
LEARALPKLLNSFAVPTAFTLRQITRRWGAVEVALAEVQRAIQGAPPIADSLYLALLLAEDHRFESHVGIDLFATARASVACIRGRREGGSTIEQQLARTITGDKRLSLGRKLKDWVLAAHIAHSFSKREIATAYLEVGYFGYHKSGYRHASAMLGHDPDRLSHKQICNVVSLLKRTLGIQPSLARYERFQQRSWWLQARVTKVLKARALNGETLSGRPLTGVGGVASHWNR